MERNTDSYFEMKYNPFRYDINGSKLDLSEDVKLSKELMLKPDLNTLKEVPWSEKEALVIADVHCSDNQAEAYYAPRNIIKKLIKDH